MKRHLLTAPALAFLLLSGPVLSQEKWMSHESGKYTVYYTQGDAGDLEEYGRLFERGSKIVTAFFGAAYTHPFGVHIHPSRASLDRAWQLAWNMPDFTSQCWMVASGTADRFDLIAPKRWDSLACEHSYADSLETQRLITHELVHVIHGQKNQSPDFSDVSGIDWFIEGLAVYASGQCDDARIAQVKEALKKEEAPEQLSGFWSGPARYGLSGSMVMYLDERFGRERLFALLEFNHLEPLLAALEVTEPELLSGWKTYMEGLSGL
jgi:hypothetical protein